MSGGTKRQCDRALRTACVNIDDCVSWPATCSTRLAVLPPAPSRPHAARVQWMAHDCAAGNALMTQSPAGTRAPAAYMHKRRRRGAVLELLGARRGLHDRLGRHRLGHHRPRRGLGGLGRRLLVHAGGGEGPVAVASPHPCARPALGAGQTPHSAPYSPPTAPHNSLRVRRAGSPRPRRGAGPRRRRAGARYGVSTRH
jgi:hypothetical protein